MEFLKFLYYKFLMNQLVLSFLSGFIGAVIGAVATCWATQIAHKNNLELERQKLRNEERSVVLSIIEEIKTIKEIYEPLMNECFSEITKDHPYLETYYIVTQDFFTVYSNNASKLGLIEHDELRNNIVKIYIYMKKFLEDFNILRLLHENSSENKSVYSELTEVSNRLKNGYREIENLAEQILGIVKNMETPNERI